jgi:hypothetical protein
MTNFANKRISRDIGPEMLRILSMFFIVLHHLAKHGGIGLHISYRFDYWLHQILSVLFIVSVNCFVLITCWYSVNCKFKFKKLLSLWLQVVFYCLFVYIIAVAFTDNTFDIKAFIKCAFPITQNTYWFFTQYFIFMLCLPFLSVLVNNISKKQLFILTSILIVIVSINPQKYFPDFFLFNVFKITTTILVFHHNNFWVSFLWFSVLFLITTCLKLHLIEGIKKIRTIEFVLIYIVLAVLLLFYNVYLLNFRFILKGLMTYHSIIVVIMSFTLFLSFLKLNIKTPFLQKVILFISPLTFGIYLVHANYGNLNINDIIYFKILQVQNCYGMSTSALIMIGLGLLLFIGGGAIEYLRIKIFQVLTLIIPNSNK